MRLAEIEAHIGSMGELLDLVGAMRSLAGMRMQEAQRSLAGVRAYADTMVTAIADTIPLAPEAHAQAAHLPHRRGIVLCMAEHGFVGGFNERLAEAAEAELQPDDRLFVLGSRGAVLLEERGVAVTWSRPMASRSAAAMEMVHSLTSALYRQIAEGLILRIEVMFARPQQGSGTSIAHRKLLPVDLEALSDRSVGQPPLTNLAAGALQEKLIAEYVFALLTEAAVESIASENAARFAAMDSAHNAVGKKLDTLRHDAQQARQSEITTELLDLVTGAEAMNED